MQPKNGNINASEHISSYLQLFGPFIFQVFSVLYYRMAPERPDWTPVDGRIRDRPKKTWRSTFIDDLQARAVSWSEVEVTAADRVCWRNLLPIDLQV